MSKKRLSLSVVDPACYRRAMYQFYQSDESKQHPGVRPSDKNLQEYDLWRETNNTPVYKFDTYVKNLNNSYAGPRKVEYVKSHAGGRGKKKK